MDNYVLARGFSIPHDVPIPEITQLNSKNVKGVRRVHLNKYTVYYVSNDHGFDYLYEMYSKYAFYQVREICIKGSIATAYCRNDGQTYRAFRVEKGLAILNIFDKQFHDGNSLVVERSYIDDQDTITIKHLDEPNIIVCSTPISNIDFLINRYPQYEKVVSAVVSKMETADKIYPIYANHSLINVKIPK